MGLFDFIVYVCNFYACRCSFNFFFTLLLLFLCPKELTYFTKKQTLDECNVPNTVTESVLSWKDHSML